MSRRIKLTSIAGLVACSYLTVLMVFTGIAAACSGGGGGGGGCTAPSVSTGGADSITSNSATLTGSVNPQGCHTTYAFEYGRSSEGYPNEVIGSAGSGTSPVSVRTYSELALQPSTSYHFRLTAWNSGDEITGGSSSFTTTATCTAPSVVTDPASLIKSKSATLNGRVNPHGCESSYAFEYRKSTDSTYTSVLGWTGRGTVNENVSKEISNLEPLTEYVFRLVAANTHGTTSGSYLRFTTAPPPTKYVAMGDSYSAGTGTGASYEPGNSGSCHRTTKAYPYLPHNYHPQWEYTSVACHGATTNDMLGSQVNNLTYGTNWITYSIGGNDAGFGPVIRTCVNPIKNNDDCEKAVHEARTVIEFVLPSRLDNVNNEIKFRSPNAKVIVLGYPLLFNGKLCSGGGLLSLNQYEQALLNDASERLRTVISAARARAGSNFIFRDPIPGFIGHAVCDGGSGSATEWIWGVTSPEEESYHPKVAGQANVYFPLVKGITG